MPVRVKICGITSADDAMTAAMLGADAIGFVFAESPRRVQPDTVRSIVENLPPFVTTVGLFVDAPIEEVRHIRDYCCLDMIQLHGNETEQMMWQLGGRLIKAVKVRKDRIVKPQNYPQATLLLDTYDPVLPGGTGVAFDWRLAVAPARLRPIVLAGGLTPENVVEAIRTVNPYAVDVSSGVESEPGRKDYGKLADFIRNAKSAHELP